MRAIAGQVVFVILALSWMGCTNAEDEAEKSSAAIDDREVLAWIGEEPITSSMLVGRRGLDTDEARRRAVERAIDSALLAAEARTRGLDALPEVQAALKAIRREAHLREQGVLRRALLDDLLAEVVVDDTAIQAEYEKRKGQFMEPQLHFRQRVFRAQEEALRFSVELGKTGRLEVEGSTDLPPVSLRRAPRDLFPEILELRESGDRVVVKRDEGWCVVELVEKLPAGEIPLDDVRDQLEKRVLAQRKHDALKAQVEALRANAEIRINETALEDDELWSDLDPPRHRRGEPDSPRK